MSDLSAPQWMLQTDGPANRLVLRGEWTTRRRNLPQLPAAGLASATPGVPLGFDTAGVTQWDTALVGFLWEVRQDAAARGLAFDGAGLPPAALKLLGLLPERRPEPHPVPKRRFAPVAALGTKTLGGLTELGALSELAAQMVGGSLSLLRGRSRMRPVDLLTGTRDAGPGALPIVSLVNFLIGAILAFVGAVQLRKFAADIYVANLVAIAMVREMAAVMTAIIVAGRTGGAYAARIATMRGNEEIDALTVSGIPLSSYLILPSVLALMGTMPLLYLYACLVSLIGGGVVAVMMLDVTASGYLHQTLNSFGLTQFVFGFVKSLVFAAYIGLVSCRIGLQAGRSAADVGIAATRAVVAGVVGVIAIDSLFAILANALDI